MTTVLEKPTKKGDLRRSQIRFARERIPVEVVGFECLRVDNGESTDSDACERQADRRSNTTGSDDDDVRISQAKLSLPAKRWRLRGELGQIVGCRRARSVRHSAPSTICASMTMPPRAPRLGSQTACAGGHNFGASCGVDHQYGHAMHVGAIR
jgi:hypothetical protein